MGWSSNIFSSAGVNVISSISKVMDGLVARDEEIVLTDIQQKKIKAAYNVKMQELMLSLDRRASQYEETLENELVTKLKLDMKSDSWLSKNIRPMTLIFMTLVVSILAFATIFTDSFSEGQLDTIKSWIPFFQTVMLTIYGFYFGSRGFEKIQKMRVSKTSGASSKGLIPAFDQEPRG